MYTRGRRLRCSSTSFLSRGKYFSLTYVYFAITLRSKGNLLEDFCTRSVRCFTEYRFNLTTDVTQLQNVFCKPMCKKNYREQRFLMLNSTQMNPTPNVMSQDSGSIARQQPKPLRGTSERTFTAVVQLVCGFIAMACGLVLVALKNPYDDNYYGYRIARFGKAAFGIWGGLVFIATAVPYFFGKHKKSMVGFYLGFCLASAVIAVVGLGLSITAINKIVFAKSDTDICIDVVLGVQSDQKYRCCTDNYRYDYDCRPSYYQHYSWYDYRLPTTYGYPRLSFGSLECQSFREHCLQEVKRLYVPHLVFFGIMVAVLSVELFASVYGACAALSALCNCCVGGKPTQYYPCSFNQLMVNDSLNHIVIPPQVTTQHPGPAVIATTQVPNTYTPLQVPPQTGPPGYGQNSMYEVLNR